MAVLGPLEVLSAQGPVALGAPKERAVVEMLALRAGQPVSAESLCSGLWGASAPPSAAKALQSYVSHLRRVLPPRAIATKGSGYVLVLDPASVDVHRFEEYLREAARQQEARNIAQAAVTVESGLTLWRGHPCPELTEHSWATAEVVRLEELLRQAEDELSDLRLSLGQHDRLVGDLEAAVAREPLRERRWAQLMLALYRAGRQADALRAYSRLRSTLAEELGIGPSAELVMLERSVLEQSSDLDYVQVPGLAPGLPGLTPGGPQAANPTSRSTVLDSPPSGSDRGGDRIPSDHVTFLCADVEGFSRLSQRRGDRSLRLLPDHRRVILSAVAAHRGVQVNCARNGLFIVFADATQAVAACLNAQKALTVHPWPDGAVVRVRMGLHTGMATATPDDAYTALAVDQAASIAAAAHGGQVLVSAPTAGLLKNMLPPQAALAARGHYVLGDFDGPVGLYQLTHPDLLPTFPPLRAAPAIPHNLPEVRTSFVGRHDDLATLAELVTASRLVTVVGPGGAGKTRLCLELVARLAPSFEAGAQLSDLSPLVDPSLVQVTIASLYGVRDTGGADLTQAVGRELAGQPALLLLDNCEHVLDAAAGAVEALLAAAPGLRVLATSREPLGVEGEQLWRISPLAVPRPAASALEIGHNESVRLFEDRARLGQPTFTVDEQNAAAVASICRQLEGLPLGIELTAARVAAMSPATIAARLDHLTETPALHRRTTRRHSSLDATIDWSYQLLNSEERRLLRSLSVFAGGFTLEAVEAVAGTERPLDGLASLVNKSLVVYTDQSERYHLLETIRAFARARVQEAGDADQVALRHLRWCAAFAEPVWESSLTSREDQLLAAVEHEIDNIRVAVSWAAHHGALEGLKVVGRLIEYWFLRAPVEGGSWAERMLAATDATDPVATGIVLAVQSACAIITGDVSVALRASATALAMLRETDDLLALLCSMVIRAMATTYLPDPTESNALNLEASELAAQTGHTTFELLALSNLGESERARGHFKKAVDYAVRSMDGLRGGDFPASLQADARINLGRSRLLAGASVAEVHPVFVEAFSWAARTRASMIVARVLDCLAETVAPSQPESAGRLLGAAKAVRRTHGVSPHEWDQSYHDAQLRAVEKAIGPERTSELLGSVEDLSLDQALQLGRQITETN